MEALGAVVATINFNELQMALKQGLVDGQENPVAVNYASKLYEAQKYLAMTRHNYNAVVHLISKKVWDKLTPEQQATIREESRRAGEYTRKKRRPRRPGKKGPAQYVPDLLRQAARGPAGRRAANQPKGHSIISDELQLLWLAAKIKIGIFGTIMPDCQRAEASSSGQSHVNLGKYLGVGIGFESRRR